MKKGHQLGMSEGGAILQGGMVWGEKGPSACGYGLRPDGSMIPLFSCDY
ncbi:MAG: hypothetical protein ACMUIA_04500 [bacterium]